MLLGIGVTKNQYTGANSDHHSFTIKPIDQRKP